MRDSRGIENWRRVRILIAGAALAFGTSSCLGEDEFAGEGDETVGSQEKALETECTAADLTFSPPSSETSACAGPWTYQNYDTEVSRSSLCGAQTCTLFKSCTRWVAQTPKTFTHDYDVPKICEPDPETGCNWLNDIATANSMCADFRDEDEAEVEAPADQRVTSSSSSRTTLAGHPPGNVPGYWTHRCAVTVNYEKSFTGRHQDCGCETWQYPSCKHIIGSVRQRVSPPGKTKQWVKDQNDETAKGPQLTDTQINAACTTGQELASFPAKLGRLLDSLGNSAVVTPGTDLHKDFIRRAKRTYEFYTNSDVAAANARHADAQGLYQTYPDIEPTCGLNKPVTAQTCNGDWRLRMCTRLTSAHVKVEPGRGDLVSQVYPSCITQLQNLGDDISSGACSAGGDFAAVSVDTHRRLHDKLLVRYGLALSPSPSVDNTPVIADVLHKIDRWYPQAARIFAEPAGAQAELELAANKFWQVGYGYKPTTEETDWIADSTYADLSAALEEAKAVQDEDPEQARQIVESALSDTDTRGFKLDREVVKAAYGNTGTEAVMVGAPLLEITASALDPLVARLEDLVQVADVGCSLADCATFSTPTKLSRFWKVLAHLRAPPGSVPDLGDVIAAAPGTMLGWKPVFQAIDARQQRLLDAIAAAPADPNGRPRVVELVDRALARSSSYEATGLFLPAVGDRMFTGVHADQRARVKEHTDFLNGLLAATLASLETRLVSLVDGLVRVNDGETALEQLRATETRLKSEWGDLQLRADAFGKLIDPNGSDVEDEPIYDQLMAQWAQVEGAIDEQAYLREGSSTEVFMRASYAKFQGWDNAASDRMDEVGASKIEVRVDPASPGNRALSIATDGRWSPSCALRDVRMIDPEDEGAEGQHIDPTGVLTGPEGYAINWTGSSYEASADHTSMVGRLTVGFKSENCGGAMLFGSGTTNCAYLDASLTGETGTNWEHGSQGSTSAQFTSGVFLENTPFEAPAGALVVVEMPPGDTDPHHIREVHLVHEPHTTIVVDGPADLWLAANDIKCAQQNDQQQLHVVVTRYQTVGDAAGALVGRMAHTISLIRGRKADLVARGELLTSERTEIELQAKLDQIGGPGEPQIAVDDYPEPMKDLFYKFLAHEMTRLEAQVRLASIVRELALKKQEHQAAELAVKNSQMSGFLLSLVPSWTARGLHFKELRDISSMYASTIRYYMAPLLKVWYPDVRTAMAALAPVQSLSNVDLDTPALTVAGWLTEIGTQLGTRIQNAQLPYPSPQDTAPSFVALRFPNPTVLDPACADSPSARCRRAGQGATFRWATVAQTRALWGTLGQPGDGQTMRRLVFQPSPDDLYQLVGTHYLSCTKSLPVVRKVGLALTGYAASQLPPEQRDMQGTIPAAAPMGFPDASGVREFQLENPSWHNLANVPLIYAQNDYNEVKADFTALAQDVRGVSPFTTFVFNIPESVVVEWNLRGARTIDLILELEAVRANEFVAVPVCTAAQ